MVEELPPAAEVGTRLDSSVMLRTDSASPSWNSMSG